MYLLLPQRKKRIAAIITIAIIPILTIMFTLMALSRPAQAAESGATIDVNSTADNLTASDTFCTLREALTNANNDNDTTGGDCNAGNGRDTINIPAGTYSLTLVGIADNANATGDLDILDSVTLLGAGEGSTIIDGNSADRIFDIDPNSMGLVVEIHDLTITNGAETSGGGLRQIFGQTTLQNVTVSNNSAVALGGGIQLEIGVMHILSSTLQENSANSSNAPTFGGGGLYTWRAGVFIHNSLVYSNTAMRNGGGIHSDNGSLTLNNTQVLSNTAIGSSTGGGIFSDEGNVIVENSSLIAYNQSNFGGGLYVDTALLYIKDSTVRHNSAITWGGGAHAENDGLIITNSIFEYNTAGSEGGAVHSREGGTIENSTFQFNNANWGGGIHADSGLVRVSDSTFYSNTAIQDGGMFNGDDGSLAMYRSIVQENSAGDDGGGIHLNDDYPFYYIADSLIISNTAVNDGGGLHIADECSLHLERVTVTGNIATNGGGLYMDDECGLQTFNTTFSNNTAANGGGIYLGADEVSLNLEYSTLTNNTATVAGGGVYISSDGFPDNFFNIRNSILAGNSISGTLNDPTADCVDVPGNFVSGGHNLFGSGTGCPADPVFDQTVTPSDVATTVLFPLADNGGATLPGGSHLPTHALRSGSPAIDDGSDLLCPTDDQVGTTRPQGNGCDVGAMESAFSATPFVPNPNTITVTAFTDDLTDNGNCTLREAVQAANTDSAVDNCAAGSGWDVISLSAGTYSLTITSTNENNNLDGDLDVLTGSITFQGAGENLTIIDGAADGRLVHAGSANAAAVFFQDLTLTNGLFSGSYGGCFYAVNGLAIFNRATVSNCKADSNGGGVSGDIATLILVESLIENNQTTGVSRDGGGLWVEDGPMLLFDSQVISNSATADGGGIYIEHTYLLLDNSAILSNTAKRSINADGGGYYGYEAGLIMRNSSLVQYNVVTGTLGDGGGLQIYSGAIIDDSTISHNFATGSGGGFLSDGGTWIRNSLIEYNQAGGEGGGLKFSYGGTIENSTIQYNQSLQSNGGGGGLQTSAGATIIASNFYSNTAFSGGGLFNDFGGFYITNSDIRWNSATVIGTGLIEGGGGINSNDGSLLLVQSNVSHNNSAGQGGGLTTKDGSVDIIQSTIAHNTAITGGGILAKVNVNLLNSTVSSNNAQAGGGIYNNFSGNTYLHFSTVANNTATNDGGGLYNLDNIILASSIVAGNSANGSPIDGSADCQESWPVTFTGYSLFGTITGCSASASTDLTVDPATIFTAVLGPLADNGGPLTSSGLPAFTHALLTGSSAINQIPTGEHGCGTLITTDQRNQPRPTEAGCDIGAFEYQPANYLLTVFLAGTGSGTVSGPGISCPGDCTETYLEQTVVTLTASANTGSTFTGWSGDCTGTGDCIVTMDAAKNVTADFTLDQHDLNVALAGDGSGTVTGPGITCPGDCDETYDYGTVVTLTASANTGSTFTGWSGDCTGTADCVVTMDQAQNVTATFTEDQTDSYELFMPVVLKS